ncbi:MAG TPA: OB-fold nucleic acid binding domain-containing protein, partial [Capsulimonadaceae bacterium]|nr:OB-fold nucleic acid binding domain-containing protein [Capsulimonadaceae bacterium]
MAFPKRTLWCGEVSEAQVGETVTINGWVNRVRDQGGIVFIDLRDRTGVVQVVADSEHSEQALQI